MGKLKSTGSMIEGAGQPTKPASDPVGRAMEAFDRTSRLNFAAGDFIQRRQARRSQWEYLRGDLLAAIESATAAIERPRGISENETPL